MCSSLGYDIRRQTFHIPLKAGCSRDEEQRVDDGSATRVSVLTSLVHLLDGDSPLFAGLPPITPFTAKFTKFNNFNFNPTLTNEATISYEFCISAVVNLKAKYLALVLV